MASCAVKVYVGFEDPLPIMACIMLFPSSLMPLLGISHDWKSWKYSLTGIAISNLNPFMNSCSPVIPKIGSRSLSKLGTFLFCWEWVGE